MSISRASQRMHMRLVPVCLVLLLVLAGCSSSRRLQQNQHQQVYSRLGIKESRGDYFNLYKEASFWLNTPHQEGGLSRRGIDCSGFVYLMYKNVYNITLERSSQAMYKKNCKPLSMGQLCEGDLVFFNTSGRSSSQINHVGIYLKNNLFIHSSTSRGVMVSSLNENYYRRTWICGGRVYMYR